MVGKRISDKMEKELNAQMTREAHQSQVYLSYASWAEVNSYTGVADFLYKHALEERNHMLKILKYINERGGSAKIEAIKAPPADPEDLGDCLNKTLQHEVNNSKAIDEIVNLAHEERDWATFNFGQWFVKEQIEEEALISALLDKYKLIGSKKAAGLYEFDRDIASAPQHTAIPREASFE